MAKTFEEQLCNILVSKKIFSKQKAKSLQDDFKDRSKETFDSFLLSEGLIKKEDLLGVLSTYYKVPGFDVVGHFFNHNLLLEFPQDFLVREGLIPLQREDDILVIIASEPNNEDLLPDLAEYVSDEIQFNVGIKNDIVNSVIEYYKDSPFSFDEDEIDIDEDEELYEDENLLEDIYENSNDEAD